MTNLSEAQFGYRGGHQPSIEGPGAHEVDQIYPDYYDHPEYYHSMLPNRPQYRGYHIQHNRAERETMVALSRVRGNPNAQLDMYRAVPHGVKHINPGDWVTPSKEYANIHAESNLGPEGGAIIHARVLAHRMRAPGDYIHEFGYAGPRVKGRLI